MPFERELSIVAVRGRDGATAFYPLVENVHRDGILRTSVAPAPASAPTLQASTPRPHARAVLERARLRRRARDRAVRGRRRPAGQRDRAARPQLRATGRSRAPRPASSRTTCAPCSGCRSARPTPIGHAAMVNLIGDGARPARGRGRSRRPPPPVRQGAAPGPQARPRHGPWRPAERHPGGSLSRWRP